VVRAVTIEAMKDIDQVTRIRLAHMAGAHPASVDGCPVCRHADTVARIWRNRRQAIDSEQGATTAA
jgi:hypothetical protein